MKAEFPNYVEALKTRVHQQQVLLKQLQAQMRRYEGLVASYERETARLKSQLDKLKRRLFGQGSEKLRNKLEKKIRETEKRLGETEYRLHTGRGCLEAVSTVIAESDIGTETATENADSARSLSRRPLPATLPRKAVRIEPAETVCPACASSLAALSETDSEQLDIISNAFKVIETIRPKLACPSSAALGGVPWCAAGAVMTRCTKLVV